MRLSFLPLLVLFESLNETGVDELDNAACNDEVGCTVDSGP